ncbi:MAG: response regulator [Bacteroidota bacterium]|nr:response regulator [Bacteroidota bacterium]
MPRILIVDDDKDLLTVIKSLLTKKGFDVSVYSDPVNLLPVVKHLEPQVILLDVFLAGKDGLEICKKLKSSPFSHHIPVIIFSAYSQIEETAIDEFGAHDFIAKPFEINELMLKIDKALLKRKESL